MNTSDNYCEVWCWVWQFLCPHPYLIICEGVVRNVTGLGGQDWGGLRVGEHRYRLVQHSIEHRYRLVQHSIVHR